MTATLTCANVLAWCETYHGPKAHALLSDPPYNLGFQDQAWDNNIAMQPRTWAALASHLLPGAFGCVFASSRGWHRLACAIEDAKLLIHPSIFGWARGNGQPKATQVGDPRFQGHRYGLQALKPALEPIIVFQKPYQGMPQASIKRTGAGALNIDAARVDTPGQEGRWPANLVLEHTPACRPIGTMQAKTSGQSTHVRTGGFWYTERTNRLTIGHGYGDSTGHEAVSAMDCAPGCPVADLYSQTALVDDPKGAARYFVETAWVEDVAEQLDQASPVQYAPSPSKRERQAGCANVPLPAQIRATHRTQSSLHPTMKPLRLTHWLARLLLPPLSYAPRRLLVPFAGVASEMIGGVMAGWEDICGIEREQLYVDIGYARLHYWGRGERVMRQAMMLIGMPGSGKSTLVQAALAGLAYQALQEGPLHYLKYPGGIELGQRRERFSGTDALALNIMPVALAWLHTATALGCSALLAEGDRLANAKFLHDLEETGWLVTLVWLDCPIMVAMLRCWDRASHQNNAWFAGRATKVKRLAKQWDRCCWRLDARQPVPHLAQQLRSHPVIQQLRQEHQVCTSKPRKRA